MRPSARTWLAVGATLVVAGTVVVPLTARLRATAAVADAFADDLGRATDGSIDLQRDDDGLVRFVGTDPGTPLDLGIEDPAGAADAFAARLGDDLGEDRSTLEVIGTEPRADGGLAVRYQQLIGGIPVFGAQASVQVDATGGVLSSLADLSSRVESVPTETGVPVDEARSTALAVTSRATGAPRASLTADDGEAWVYDPSVVGPPSPFGPHLTWRFEITGNDPPVRHLVLIDAESGAAVLAFSRLTEGLDRGVCDSENNAALPEACDPPYTRGEGDPLHAVTEVNRAYDYSGDTYGFFSTVLGRDSIDGAGMTIESRVRYCRSGFTCPYNNAFWNGAQLTFGQGYALADDVVAHELTHGVTEHTANLFYYFQSGAINESMSDVFGELVDLGNGAGTDTAGVRWRLGEDLPNGAIRDMADPTAHPYSDPDRMTSAKYTADASFNDGGGVHTNSGVGNRAAVLMTDGGTFNGQDVTGLGETKTATVFYEALTTMLTSGSDYADLGLALSQSCLNLIGTAGITGADCGQVDKVVIATEMAAQPTTPGAAAPEAPVCATGTQPQNLFSDDFENPASGKWSYDTVNLGVGGFYRWAYQSEVGHDYATTGHDGLWGLDLGSTADRRVQTANAVALPAGSNAFLHFRHAYDFDTMGGGNGDGGVVEYSTNGGGTWQDLASHFDANGYNGTLAPGGSNPLAGMSAYVGRSHGYVSSRASLAALSGQDVRFRFRLGENAEHGTYPYGWFVDDVAVYTCEPIPAPALEVTQTAEPTAVVAGEAIDLTVTVHNTGNVALTGVTVDSPAAPDCEDPVADLAVDAQQVIECAYTTVDPDDIGDWSNTATVTTNELPEGVGSNAVEVEVAAPAPSVVSEVTADQSRVTAGEAIDLHVSVQNSGNIGLTGLTVTTDPTVATCDGDLADLDPDETRVVDCTYTTIDPDDVGTWSVTATVDGDQVDPLESDPAEVAVLAPGTADAAITAAADQDAVVAGEGIDLHATIENTGNVTLTDVDLGHSAATTCDGDLDDLDPDETRVVDCTYTTVDPDDVGTWSDEVTLTASELDPTGVTADPVLVSVAAPAPASEVSASADQTEVDAGEAVDLHVTIDNTGNVALTGLAVTAADEASCVGPVADLAPDATVVVDCTHVTALTDQGPYGFSATVDSDQLDPVTTDPVEVLVRRAALEVTASAQEATVVAGQPVHVDLTVTNVGNVDLTGVVLTDPLCDGAPSPIALDVGASAPLACTVTIDVAAVPAFAVVGSWSATPTARSDQSPPASSTPLVVPVRIPTHGFSDPAPWIDDALSWISYHGIATGYSDGRFRHSRAVTRGQVVNWLWRLAGSPAPAGGPGCGLDLFSDVNASAAIDWAACDPPGEGPGEQPIITGYRNGTFRSTRPITRAQVVRMVWRFAAEPAPAAGSGCGVDGFSDVPPWVRDAVDWAACDPDGAGAAPPMLTGYKNGTFRPDRDISRGQVARFLYRMAGVLDL